MHQVVTAHTYLFWVRCQPSRTSLPKKIEREPLNRLIFSLHRQTTPYKSLDPWSTSHLFLSSLHTIFATSVLVGVYLLWHEGCVGFWAHILNFSPLLGLGVAWAKSPHLPAEPMFSFSMFVSLLAINPTIWFHCACYNFTSLFHFLLPRGLMNCCSSRVNPLLHQSLLRASFAYFPYLYLFLALLANILAVPAHFTTSFLGLLQLIYYFFTSFTPMGFLLNSWGFLGPITASLPFITFQAYWPSSQPIEFINSFIELP